MKDRLPLTSSGLSQLNEFNTPLTLYLTTDPEAPTQASYYYTHKMLCVSLLLIDFRFRLMRAFK